MTETVRNGADMADNIQHANDERKLFTDFSRDVCVTITQVGQRRWQAQVEQGWTVEFIYARSAERAHAKAQRVADRIAQDTARHVAWNAAAVEFVISPSEQA